jgi:glycosyltransferase involved in cell wall biosynthesis
MSVAVLILTYNEEKNISDCIASARFADEVVVIDSGSTDRTVAIAQSLGAKVAVRAMTDGFGPQRNYALSQTETDWVLYLDADERITPGLAAEVRKVVEGNEPFAYEILRNNYAFGRRLKHGGFRPDYSLRFYPRTAVSWSGTVHEEATVTVPKRKLKNVIIHYTYTDWNRYFNKFNSYTSLMAEQMWQRGKRSSMLHIIFRPWWAFFRVYILQSGWLDGRLGFILACFHFFYTMSKYVRLYWLQKQEES